MKRMTQTLAALAAVLILAGGQGTARAEGAAPAKKDAAGGAKMEAGNGKDAAGVAAKPGAGKSAPVKDAVVTKEKEKESPLAPIVGADMVPLLEKKYPRLVKERLEFEATQAELNEALEARDGESKRDKRKAERDVPKLHGKLGKMAETLQKEYDKSVKPFQSEWDRLKDQDERLITRMANAEQDPKRNEKEIAKLQQQREELDAELTELDKTMTALRKLADVKVEPLDK